MIPAPDPPLRRQNRRISAWLWWIGALIALYTLTYHGFNSSAIDEAMPLAVTAQLLDVHSIQINPLYPALLDWGAPASNPATPIVSKYAIGESLLMLPPYAIGSILDKVIRSQALTHSPNGLPFLPIIPVLLTFTLGSVISVLTAFGVVKLVEALGYSARTGAWIGLLYAVTTFAWPYAKTLYSEPSTALAIVGAAILTIRFRQTGSRLNGITAGMCLGVAVLFRTTSVLFIPLTLIYLWPREWRNWRTYLSAWGWLVPGVAIGVAVTLGYDLIRFGRLFETGYEPGFGRAPWEALIGYLIAPSRSIILYAPIAVLIVPGAIFTARRLPRETLYLIGFGVLTIGLYATWWAWDGGGSLGPRFLLPALPVILVLIAPLIDRLRWRPVLIALGVVGFAGQIISNLVAPADIFGRLLAQPSITLSTINWQLDQSLIANTWPTYLQTRIDSTLLRALPIHNPIVVAALFTLLCAVLAVVMIIATVQITE